MFKKRLISEIDDALKALKFKREAALWNRECADFVDVIDVQTSQSRDMFTINIGIASKVVAHRCWGTNFSAMIDEPSCTVRERLGHMIYGKDVWWSFSDSRAIVEVLCGIENVALPFLERMHSVDRMIEILNEREKSRQIPPEIIYLALLYEQKGDSKRCKETFESMKLVGEWRRRASEIFSELE